MGRGLKREQKLEVERFVKEHQQLMEAYNQKCVQVAHGYESLVELSGRLNAMIIHKLVKILDKPRLICLSEVFVTLKSI